MDDHPDDVANTRPPSVEVVAQAIESPLPHALLVDAARRAIAEARRTVGDGNAFDRDAIVAEAASDARRQERALLHRVINATGVLLHTNLGRAPLGADAVAAIGSSAGASNLEYVIDSGRRGSRHDHAGALLARCCGAEAGIVVNNNAAAVLLVLAAHARNREVIVSRGELVEIGGGFRVPEILEETGATLVEVGTTNRTRVADYERAVNDRTAMLLKVHASNYRMVGFTESAEVRDLARLDAPVVVDAGSGLIDTTTPWLPSVPAWIGDEPGIRQCIADGAMLVTFSGDKLLGGPQAGVIVGSHAAVGAVARHPLARAMRADKLTLAALQTVALHYLRGDVAATIPFWIQATTSVAVLRTRASAIVGALAADAFRSCAVIDTEAAIGGGSVPGRTIPSVGIAVRATSLSTTSETLARLRDLEVIAIARDERVVCDVRTVDAGDDVALAAALHLVLER